jgi:8-oxo-dGTP diphosphatase
MSDVTPAPDEHAFLEAYRAKASRYARPAVTVDVLAFTIVDEQLRVLLIRRNAPPFRDHWALPGGFVDVGDGFDDQGESLDDAARRELGEEAFAGRDVDTLLASHNVYLEQLYTFGRPGRDPRMRILSVAYFALVPPDLVPETCAGSDADDARWFTLGSIDRQHLAFDHAHILDLAVRRIRGKLDYSPIAFSLVPDPFTISELRRVYEIVHDESYDRANFTRRFRRMISDGLIEETQALRKTGRRPAKLYSFRRTT